MEKKYFCPKCNNRVIFEDVSDGYFAYCEFCDEDFYKFEVIEIVE